MDCEKVQEQILESMDAFDLQAAAHIAGCPACAAFAARQRALDARLRTALAPPELSPAFRATLHKKIRPHPARPLPDWLPDILHFATCGVATLACALLLPFHVSAILGAGASATAITYLFLTALRTFLEDAEDVECAN